MFPEPKTENTGSTALSIFIAVLVLLMISGGISWFYFNSKSSAPESVATTTPTTSANDPVETASTTISDALQDLDAELAAIDADLNSTDDDVPTL
ncbi:MAG: hypothetical protein UX60_C0006G0007 [Berkelbacteria bacterium GW2011_GWA2_46_7]|uniref:Uncharacterized protein n=1 Tax=Berkelbacteria bacterium GW2011_GWA2_46_7 TaxID=1618335 RepID=A0A0G1SR13_9BACT|nr:MAG: hypothetical protein UX60_C0006G0007 [Berkelbacteria bacterium GW2011_GWA2_46_7]